MSFPQYVSDAALTACGRCCCICHKFCGTKIELHHIKQVAYGGKDTFENCIPLCFDCHADMGKADPNHNKGKKYSEAELVMHRDNWYKRIGGLETRSYDQQTQEISICEDDKKLFEEICDVFTPDIQYWLAHANFYNPFNGVFFTALDKLLEKDNDPFFSFVSPELEILKKQLFNTLDAFLETVSMNTFHTDKDHPRRFAGHAWLLNQGYIEGRGYKTFEDAEAAFDKETKILNEHARELWSRYCNFVKTGKTLINT